MRAAQAVDAPEGWWERVSECASPRLRAIEHGPAATWAREIFAKRHAMVAIVLFLVGAVVMQRHAVAHIGTVIAGNLVGDPTQYMWSMWWWPHAILHGLNPFVTHAIWVPDTYNLGSVTSTPLPSLLFAPITALLGPIHGPVVDYNLCNLIAPILSAWFVYRLCLYLSGAPAASILGGWLFGFSAYGLSQLQGHMNLVFTFLPAVLLLLSLQRMDGVISCRRYVALAAVALAAQILIGTEIVFTTTCLLGLTLAVAVILAPRATRVQILSLVPELLGGYLLAIVVCAPFLYYALTGPEIEANVASVMRIADLLSFAVPTPIIRIGANRFAAVSAGFPSFAGYPETGHLPRAAGHHRRARVLGRVVAALGHQGPCDRHGDRGDMGARAELDHRWSRHDRTSVEAARLRSPLQRGDAGQDRHVRGPRRGHRVRVVVGHTEAPVGTPMAPSAVGGRVPVPQRQRHVLVRRQDLRGEHAESCLRDRGPVSPVISRAIR